MMNLIMEQLRGRAAKWASQFKLFRVEFNEFIRRFYDYFDDMHVCTY